MIKDPWCVLGLPFDPVSMTDVRGFIFDAVKNKAAKTLTTTNVNWLVLAHKDPLFREQLAFSDMNVMDGVPLFWCAQFLGYPFPKRVAGPAIVEDLMRHKGETKIRAYLYGGIGSAAEKACARLNKLSVSGLIGAGYCNPGFGDLEAISAEDKIQDIQRAAPDMIVLAIGAQKGMAWIEKNRSRFRVGIISHLGAVINMLAGTIKRAPRWLQPTGFEWVWRISQERKLWERYVNDGFVFLFILLTRLLPLKWHLAWHRHFEAERTQPEIALTETSDRVAVSVRGICNRFGRRNVQEGFLRAASAGKNVTIDLSETVYFESSFLGNLFLLKKEIKNAGKELLVEGATGRAEKLFELYGVSKVFAVKLKAVPNPMSANGRSEEGARPGKIMQTRCVMINPSDPFGAKVGGSETFLNGLIEFAPEDIAVDYVGISADPKARPLQKWTDCRLGEKAFRFFPVLEEKNENRKTLTPLTLRFTSALYRSKPDLAGAALFFNRFEPALLYRKTPRKTLIVHNDVKKQLDLKQSEVFWRFFPGVYFFLEKKILATMDQIYAVSQNTVDFYDASYPALRGKVSFLPTFVDTRIFKPAPVPKREIRAGMKIFGNDVEGKWILFVGRFQEQKAPSRLIEVFERYRRTDATAKLLMIGEGNLKRGVEALVQQKGLTRDVFFSPSVPREAVVPFYQVADVFLLASNFEGMPMSVLEALACGTPVVTPPVGEVGKVVKNGSSGEITAGFQPDDIVKAVIQVLTGPERYPSEVCVKAIEDYVPQKVLHPVYEKIRKTSGRD